MPLDDLLTLDNIGTALLLGIGAVVTMFVVCYGALARWWENPVGIALLASKASMMLLVAFVAASLLFGDDWYGREVVRVILYALLFATQTTLLVLLLQHLSGRRPRPKTLDGNPNRDDHETGS